MPEKLERLRWGRRYNFDETPHNLDGSSD